MAELKTQRTTADVGAFLAAVPDDRRRADAEAICALFTEVTGEQPALWGPSVVGFGQQRLRYDSGRELDWMLVGFSPRKQATVLYGLIGFDGDAELLQRLGPHTTGKGCLYVKRLDTVDVEVLRELARRSIEAQLAR